MRLRFTWPTFKNLPSHGTCPVCRRRVRVTKHAHVARHHWWKGDCDAQYVRPVELVGENLERA